MLLINYSPKEVFHKVNLSEAVSDSVTVSVTQNVIERYAELRKPGKTEGKLKNLCAAKNSIAAPC